MNNSAVRAAQATLNSPAALNSPAFGIAAALAKNPALTVGNSPAFGIAAALAKNPAFSMLLSAFPHGATTARERDDGPSS